MKSILALATITFKEGIRNRSVYGIVIFALFILGLNVAVAGFFMREIGKVTVDMNLSALSFSGLLLVFFVGINLMAKDIDRKTIHLVLSKPISRIEYIWGKYLGLLLFVGAALLVVLSFSSITVLGLRALYPAYFEPFSWMVYFLAAFFIFLRLAVLSAIVVFFSAITTSSFVTLIFSVCSYLVGQTIEEVVFYLRSSLPAEEISISLRRFIEGITHVFPNLTAFDFQIEAAHALPIGGERIATSLGYGVVYIALLLLLASLIFRRREFN